MALRHGGAVGALDPIRRGGDLVEGWAGVSVGREEGGVQ
jgi:hypothetical protein